jgi:hypothetical protein
MEPTMTRTADGQIQLYDDKGRLIGVITRPVVTDVLGPGREKVYLARRTERPTQHAA